MYKSIVKPILFKIDPELVHELALNTGYILSKSNLICEILSKMYSFENARLEKTIHGIKFNNPIGLAAGFDYDAKLASIMNCFGFGFNTVGTVTAKEYEGNPKPRLVRLPKSKSILVNKGFKSQGVYVVSKRLNNPKLKDITFGVSVGSSNIPSVNTIQKAIDDYIESFSVLKENKYIKYFELNISCPNVSLMTEDFTNKARFEMLLKEISTIGISKPIFIKMPNEIDISLAEELVQVAMKYNINSFIFSNLVKSRKNKYLDRDELEQIMSFKGNFSGKPTQENATSLVKHFKNKYKDNIILVSCGGIFTPQDAINRIQNGADLLQLITGMIYKGPSVIKEMNKMIFKKYMNKSSEISYTPIERTHADMLSIAEEYYDRLKELTTKKNGGFWRVEVRESDNPLHTELHLFNEGLGYPVMKFDTVFENGKQVVDKVEVLLPDRSGDSNIRFTITREGQILGVPSKKGLVYAKNILIQYLKQPNRSLTPDTQTHDPVRRQLIQALGASLLFPRSYLNKGDERLLSQTQNIEEVIKHDEVQRCSTETKKCIEKLTRNGILVEAIATENGIYDMVLAILPGESLIPLILYYDYKQKKMHRFTFVYKGTGSTSKVSLPTNNEPRHIKLKRLGGGSEYDVTFTGSNTDVFANGQILVDGFKLVCCDYSCTRGESILQTYENPGSDPYTTPFLVIGTDGVIYMTQGVLRGTNIGETVVPWFINHPSYSIQTFSGTENTDSREGSFTFTTNIQRFVGENPITFITAPALPRTPVKCVLQPRSSEAYIEYERKYAKPINPDKVTKFDRLHISVPFTVANLPDAWMGMNGVFDKSNSHERYALRYIGYVLDITKLDTDKQDALHKLLQSHIQLDNFVLEVKAIKGTNKVALKLNATNGDTFEVILNHQDISIITPDALDSDTNTVIA